MLAEPLGDRIVLLDRSGMELITLNAMGSLLWSSLPEAQDAFALAAVAKLRHPGVAPERIDADVAAFVATLLERGVLVDAGG